ncbi:hypothetical protein Nm8I071_24130 [Nonomuraea sp. TT08I-71]|nr:hypothetical protein Nm8I071_24130 [Nonomuraea sp. TT08I-71]
MLYETVVGEGMYLAMTDYDDALAARLTGQYAAMKLPPAPVDEDDPAGRVHWYGGRGCSFPCKAMPPCGSADVPSRTWPKPSGPCPASGTTSSEASHPLRPVRVPVNLARGRLGRLPAVWVVKPWPSMTGDDQQYSKKRQASHRQGDRDSGTHGLTVSGDAASVS